MRLNWVQIIPQSKFSELQLRDITFLKQEIESGNLSVNACDERGEPLLSHVTLPMYRCNAVSGILIS